MADVTEQVDFSVLPHSMQRLIRIIGLHDTLALLRARGGTVLHIPERVETKSMLAVLISKEALTVLVNSELAGLDIQLPKVDKYDIQLRNYAIRNTNISHTQAALDFGLSRQQIHNIRGDDGQIDMFE